MPAAPSGSVCRSITSPIALAAIVPIFPRDLYADDQLIGEFFENFHAVALANPVECFPDGGEGCALGVAIDFGAGFRLGWHAPPADAPAPRARPPPRGVRGFCAGEGRGGRMYRELPHAKNRRFSNSCTRDLRG